jgi:hypothetical protein
MEIPRTRGRLILDEVVPLLTTTPSESRETSENLVVVRATFGSTGETPEFILISIIMEPTLKLLISVFCWNNSRFHPSPVAI